MVSSERYGQSEAFSIFWRSSGGFSLFLISSFRRVRRQSRKNPPPLLLRPFSLSDAFVSTADENGKQHHKTSAKPLLDIATATKLFPWLQTFPILILEVFPEEAYLRLLVCLFVFSWAPHRSGTSKQKSRKWLFTFLPLAWQKSDGDKSSTPHLHRCKQRSSDPWPCRH